MKPKAQRRDEGVPVCVGCLAPVQPGANYCATCGSVVGQYTEYVPFVNLRWLASGYDRLRRAILAKNGSVFARVVCLFASFALAPILLFALPFKRLAERRKPQQP